MKNGLMFLTLLFLTLNDSDWDANPGALLISSTEMWAVNQAKPVRPSEVLAFFSNASLQINNKRKGRGVWVFNTESENDEQKEKDAIPLTQDPNSKSASLVLDGALFIEKLRQQGIQFPSIDMHLSESLGTAEELIAATKAEKDVKSWYLLGRSARNTASAPKKEPIATLPPPIATGEAGNPPEETEKKEGGTAPKQETTNTFPINDQSILIEWGHPDKIKKIQESLYQEQNGTTVTENDKAVIDPIKVYEKHFYKFPIKIDVHLSPAIGSKKNKDKENKPITVGTLFAVRPKQGARIPLKNGKFSQDQRGFLLYLSAREKGPRSLRVLELKKFDVNSSEMHIQIPLQCLVKEILTKDLGKEFSVPDLEDTSNQGSVIQDEDDANPKTEDKTPKVKKLLLDLHVKTPKTTKEDSSKEDKDKKIPSRLSPARFMLDFNDVTQSYSAIASEGEDDTPPYSDKTPIVIYNKDCHEIQKIQ